MAFRTLIFSILLSSSNTLATEETSSGARCNEWLRPVSPAVALKKAPNTIGYDVGKIELRWDHNQVASGPLQVKVDQSHFPYAPFLGEKLEIASSIYTLTNVGPRQKRQDVRFIDQAFDKAQAPYSEWQNTDLIFTGKKMRAEETLRRLRDEVFEKVMALYRKRKSELDDKDFNLIKVGNRMSMNSDTLVILQGPHSNLETISSAEFADKALLTATLTQYDAASYVLPTNVMEIHSELFEDYGLPHLFRIRKNRSYDQAVRQLRQLSKNSRIAEISRYAKFGDIPPQVHALMLVRLLELTRDALTPVDVLLISTDAATRRLFLKYRFKDFALLETGKDEPEYLMSLNTGSTDFQKTYQEQILLSEYFLNR